MPYKLSQDIIVKPGNPFYLRISQAAVKKLSGDLKGEMPLVNALKAFNLPAVWFNIQLFSGREKSSSLLVKSAV